MFRTVGKVIGIAALIFLLLGVGTCIWQNCRGQNAGPEPPPVGEAQYYIGIHNTGQVIFSNDVRTTLDDEGFQVHTLYGYWEVIGGEFTFKDIILPLYERVFGEIEVIKRSE